MEYLEITYRFIFKDGSEKVFNVKLDSDTLDIVTERKDTYPEWTLLENFRCPNCPLEPEGYCPVVTNLIDVFAYFKDSQSIEEVDIRVETAERVYSKHTSLQHGINPLVGIYMTTSGCPILDKLKPMVRFHLPFATLEETNYRMISMYLVAQHFIEEEGGRPDWELKELVQIYEDIRVINKNFCDRLRALEVKDASLNALITLDCFAFSVSYSVEKKLVAIKKMFSDYLMRSGSE